MTFPFVCNAPIALGLGSPSVSLRKALLALAAAFLRETGCSLSVDLQMIKKYIDLNFREKPSLEALAKRAALSPVYFHKLFTAYFGISPAEYISALRLTAAKQALIATDSSIADIAFACGFSSQSYFNYKFKSEVGVSPLKYRKDMLSRIEI